MEDIQQDDQIVTMDIPVDTTPSNKVEEVVSNPHVIPTAEQVQIEEISPLKKLTYTCITASCKSTPKYFTSLEELNKHKKASHSAGPPCTFCPKKDEYLAKANAYVEKCKKGVNGKPIMPYIEELALELDTIDDNIARWAKKEDNDGIKEHPELYDIFVLVKMLQKLRLQQRTMGRFNPTGAIALLKWHHGMIETEKRIIAGDKTEPLQIEIIDAPKG